MKTLLESIEKIIIVSNKLPTDRLKAYFIGEGFDCIEKRQEAKPEYEGYAKNYLCLLNHAEAWKEALRYRFALIVEEDFIPVVNFGKLLLPFDYNLPDFGIAWLYTCGAQAYAVSSEGNIRGHSGTMVAYVISNNGARSLLELAESVRKDPGPRVYSPWDTKTGEWLASKGMKNYIPFRNYGEHGGLKNTEHQKYLSEYFKGSIFKMFRARGSHRADVLCDKLSFLPHYAQGSKLKFHKVRLKARLYGIARLLLGRYLSPKVLSLSKHRARLIKVAFMRQLTFII